MERDMSGLVRQHVLLTLWLTELSNRMRFAKCSMVCTMVIFIVFFLISLSLIIPGAVLVSQNPISFQSHFADMDINEPFEEFAKRSDQEFYAHAKFIGGCALLFFGIIFLIISIVMGSCAAGFAVASRREAINVHNSMNQLAVYPQ